MKAIQRVFAEVSLGKDPPVPHSHLGQHGLHMNRAEVKQNIGWFQRSMDRPTVWWFLGASLFAIATVSVFVHPIHHDVGWFLYVSSRLIDGAELYQDIVDLKPPLIFYWNVPPVWTARILGLSEIVLFKIYLLLVVVASLVLCRQVLNQTLHLTPDAVRRCLLLALLLVLLPSYSFGQSEHIMLILSMPYILVAFGRAEGRPMSRRFLLFVGGLAGLGLAQKPYFLLLWFMIEGYLALINGIKVSWRRPENIGIAMVLSIYGVFVLFGTPDYYRKIIPMAMQAYGAYDCSTAYLLLHPVTKLWIVACMAFLLLRGTASTREMRRILLISSMSFMLIVFIQNKGMPYHFYPAKAIAVVLLVVIVSGFVERTRTMALPIRAGASIGVLVIISGLFLGTGVRVIKLFRGGADPLLSPLVSLVREHARGKPILMLSSSNYPAFPLVNYGGALWSSRFTCLWLLPVFYSNMSQPELEFSYHSRDKMDVTERFLVDAVISDILIKPPVLLIVDSSPKKPGFGTRQFSFVEYFLQDPRFAELWPSYELLTVVGHHRVFKKRRDLSLDLPR